MFLYRILYHKTMEIRLLKPKFFKRLCKNEIAPYYEIAAVTAFPRNDKLGRVASSRSN